ncbi:carbohydrate-binding protein [Paenibacillus sp. BC26]|uniref:carbohydrate-binding protein n=1 Tax=Paenibacillus sp. BC26 TaxID=1881032 RepID=UPI0008EDF35C|nr:carbohydrate-binding protein [Paenibacillus sp. BC26]SFT05706.1 Carbohydrate binding module (family 6) [Paenibacillus sp. BC26]
MKTYIAKKVCSVLICLVILSSYFSIQHISSAYATPTTYYVDAANGLDTNNGSTLQTPYQTIQKAASVAQAGDTVLIRGGTYRESVTPANSGTPGNPITYMNYNNESVTISGADVIGTSGWVLDSGNVYKKTGVTSPLGVYDLQVFVDGNEMDLARWPNAGSWASYGTIGYGYITSNTIPGSSNDWTGGVIKGDTYDGWDVLGWKITGYDAATHKISYDPMGLPATGYEYSWMLPGYRPLASWGANTGSKFYLAGARVGLDIAKEWSLDKATDTLYLWAPNGDSPANHTVELKARKNGFDLGTNQYITIQGINFTACAVNALDAQHITIDRITSKYGNINRIKFDTNPPLDYPFYDASENFNTAVMLGAVKNHYGKFNTLKNSSINTSDSMLVAVGGEGSKIFNNDIYASLNNSGMVVSGKGHLISHNSIYACAAGAVAYTGYGSIFQYNHFYDDNKVSNSDGGFIHPYNNDLGNTEFHHNIINNSTGTTYGLYLDNGTSNAALFKNVIYNVPNGAILSNDPNDFVSVLNNTGYNSGKMYIQSWGGSVPHHAYMSQGVNNITSAQTFVVSNDATKNNNIESNGSPGFVNAAAADFHLTSSSPAKDYGFVLPGITDGFVGTAPDAGAFEYSGSDWTAGSNLTNPPTEPTFTPSSWPMKNLVYNSGFESALWGGSLNYDALNGWTKGGSNTAEVFHSSPSWSHNVETGFYSIKLNTGDLVEQTITGLQPNTRYQAAAYMRMDQAVAGSSVSLTVENFGGASVTPQTVTSTTWPMSHPVVTFTTGPNNTIATIKLYKDSGTANAAFIDDVSLVTAAPLASGQLDRNGWTASASHSFSNTPAGLALDGSVGSYWSTGALQTNGMWYQVDMGASQTFNKIKMNLFNNDYPVAYSIYVSNDGTNWGSSIASGTGSSGTMEVNFSPQSARYIKIVQTGSSTTNYWAMSEFNVYNVVPAASLIEFESSTSSQGVQTASGGTGTYVGWIDGGDWLAYKNVDFGSGMTQFKASIAVPLSNAGQQLELRLDSLSGTVIGTMTLSSTGSWTTYTNQSIGVSGASGIHDLYVVAKGSGSGYGNLDTFTFTNGTPTRYEAENATLSGVTIENLAAASNGKNVGYFDNTGDYVSFASVVSGNTLSIRFSNGNTTANQASLYVNGSKVQTLIFPSTGSWSTYSTLTVSLPISGSVKLQIDSADKTANGTKACCNLDYIEIS